MTPPSPQMNLRKLGSFSLTSGRVSKPHQLRYPSRYWGALAAYSIFQNIVNAAQIWLKGRRDDRIIQRLHDFHEKKHARIQAAQQLVPQEEHAELLSELPTRVKDRLKK